MSTGVPSSAEHPEPAAGHAPLPAPPAAADPPIPKRPLQEDAFYDSSVSHLPELRESDLGLQPQRRLMLPLMLFLATCASTFWVGVTRWDPLQARYVQTWDLVGQTIAAYWPIGLAYMGAVLAILLTQLLGQFLLSVKSGIPARSGF